MSRSGEGRGVRLAVLVPGLLLALVACSGDEPAPEATAQPDPPSPSNTFTNPVMEDGADPWIIRHGDYYYFMATRGDRLTVWRAEDPTRIAQGDSSTVWRPPASGPNSQHIWAPELHRLDGRWYIYYTATDRADPGDHNRYVFVLENGSDDPLTGEWTDRGRVNTELPGLDGSVFAWGGQRYFLYSAYRDVGSVLMIARMQDPWTLQGGEVQIAEPEYDWEVTGDRRICEAPQFLEGPGDTNFVVYSAAACWDDYYALGRLDIDKDADPMDPDAWQKQPEPVFIASETNGVWGTGHNAFFMSPDSSESWIVYHGKDTASGECRNRSARMQPFEWSPTGIPQFGEPVAVSDTLQRPSGDL